MMVIDIQTIRDGKIAKTYYMENWLSALSQWRAKRDGFSQLAPQFGSQKLKTGVRHAQTQYRIRSWSLG